jgi:SAM-dependent methyltransferase
MIDRHPQAYDEIDWHEIRRRELARQDWKIKGSEDWDKRAPSFADRHKQTPYAKLFLQELPLEPHLSVLDIGSGPGTLTLPLAHQVNTVTAVDFSPAMLAALRRQAAAENLTNIKTVECSWEDDWPAHGIGVHDIAIASRALAVADLGASLRKINDFASCYVFLSDRIGISPFEVGAFQAVERPFRHGPDYIFTINILYTMKIYANVKILEFPRETTFASLADAVASFAWMFHDLSDREHDRLVQYVDDHIVKREGSTVTVRRENPPRWALIWWKKQP